MNIEECVFMQRVNRPRECATITMTALEVINAMKGKAVSAKTA